MTTRFAEFAPAKLNLFLHVTGKRADGYHLLDSLVAFADVGDRLTVTESNGLSLDIGGPFAAQLEPDTDNLVLRAARFIARDAKIERGAAFVLEKNLPVASGIGGGSSDAAAAIHLVRRLWKITRDFDSSRMAAELGADVPVCLARRPMRMTGIGETLYAVDGLPPAFVVMANPGLPLPTADVFKRFRVSQPKPAPSLPKTLASVPQLTEFLAATENALTAAAVDAVPAIGSVLDQLQDLPDCLLARLSGSGPTCFGLFAEAEAAFSSAAQLASRNPTWWVQAGQLRSFADTSA